MANGSVDEKVARADRIREQSERAQRAAELNRRVTAKTIAELRATAELEPYREEMDSGSEVTVGWGPVKAHARAIPPWALGLAILVLAIAAAIVLVLRVR